MENVIINKVAESALTTIDLADYYPKGETAVFDLKDHLFRGLILREKDFRATLLTYEWEQFRDKYVGITCSTEAIIPMWAYMLVVSNLQPVAKDVLFARGNEIIQNILLKNLTAIRGEDFTDKRVVIKGCGDIALPEAAYVEVTKRLRPFVKSIMFGEPCSTVPIFKRK